MGVVTCKLCGNDLETYDDAVAYQSVIDKDRLPLTRLFCGAQHLLPVAGCEGTPTLAQYLPGQKILDQSIKNDYKFLRKMRLTYLRFQALTQGPVDQYLKEKKYVYYRAAGNSRGVRETFFYENDPWLYGYETMDWLFDSFYNPFHPLYHQFFQEDNYYFYGEQDQQYMVGDGNTYQQLPELNSNLETLENNTYLVNPGTPEDATPAFAYGALDPRDLEAAREAANSGQVEADQTQNMDNSGMYSSVFREPVNTNNVETPSVFADNIGEREEVTPDRFSNYEPPVREEVVPDKTNYVREPETYHRAPVEDYQPPVRQPDPEPAPVVERYEAPTRYEAPEPSRYEAPAAQESYGGGGGGGYDGGGGGSSDSSYSSE